METFIYLALGLVLGLAVGFVIGKSKAKPAGDSEAVVNLLKTQLAEKEAQAQSENKLLQAITPIQESLNQMQQKVDDFEQTRRQQQGTLEEQLRTSIETSNALRSQTDKLAMAMSDSKMRGAWGEVQLRRLLEDSGMNSLTDFHEQKAVEGGSKRPDVTVRLPHGRHLAIDSKVPFDAYLEASSISDIASPAELDRKAKLLKAHKDAVRNHITELSKKKYWESVSDTPPFVIAFIPSESLLSAALAEDPGLIEFAFKQGVALSSPVSLFSVLKTVRYIWQQESNEKALADIIILGKRLYERIGVIAQHAATIGESITTSMANYNAFAVSLERNLLTVAKDLNKEDETQFGSFDIVDLPLLEAEPHVYTKGELADASDARKQLEDEE